MQITPVGAGEALLGCPTRRAAEHLQVRLEKRAGDNPPGLGLEGCARDQQASRA